ncbi:MAG: hypothetical protein ABI990_12010, partial [Actinomycetota bacterium]
GGDASPFARIDGTHFARLVLIGDVVFEGSGQHDHLRAGRLLFTSNFDGRLEPYLERLRTSAGAVADEVWGHCVGYPGSGDARAFAEYLRGHQVESSLFFSAYGDRTVEDVRRSLALRSTLIEFALRAQGMTPRELQSAFTETFPA